MDVAVLIAQAAPMDANGLLNLLAGQMGLKETPSSAGVREANGISWTLYAVEVQSLLVDFALAESNGLGLIVVLQSAAKEHESLYQAVFLPAVDALTSIP